MLASFYILSRVDFVCDNYNPLSVKDSEWTRHSISSNFLLFVALNENQKTLIQFRKFLVPDKNKESLVLSMVMHWKKIGTKRIPWKNCLLLWTEDDSCCLLKMTQSDHRNFARIKYWSQGSRYPFLALCKVFINCSPFHYHQDSRYKCFSSLPCSITWIKCWIVCGR